MMMSSEENPYEPSDLTSTGTRRQTFLSVMVPSGLILIFMVSLAMLFDRFFGISRTIHTINLVVVLFLTTSAGMSAYFWTSRIIPHSSGCRPSLALSALEAVAGIVLTWLAIGFADVLKDLLWNNIVQYQLTSSLSRHVATSVLLSGFYSIAYATLQCIFFRSSLWAVLFAFLFPIVILESGMFLGVLWIENQSSDHLCALMTLFFGTLTLMNCFAWWLSCGRLTTNEYSIRTVDQIS